MYLYYTVTVRIRMYKCSRCTRETYSRALYTAVAWSWVLLTGEDFGTGTVQPFRTAYRRKTDLMPTIPSSSSSPRTPGRAYSMSRLDVLSLPRPLPSPPKTQQTLSSAKSMHSLAAGQRMLGKTDSSKSMLNIAPIPPPRLTRAERLRKKAKEAAKSGQAAASGTLHAFPQFIFPNRAVSVQGVTLDIVGAGSLLISHASASFSLSKPSISTYLLFLSPVQICLAVAHNIIGAKLVNLRGTSGAFIFTPQAVLSNPQSCVCGHSS
jgi:hypothetical protein